ncbi:MAG: hypothetical protein KF845_14975 [Cyclobacteriaceae bacterium]|nr:hypothetical protein [Cyclobacteriaceae bacterium]
MKNIITTLIEAGLEGLRALFLPFTLLFNNPTMRMQPCCMRTGYTCCC